MVGFWRNSDEELRAVLVVLAVLGGLGFLSFVMAGLVGA